MVLTRVTSRLIRSRLIFFERARSYASEKAQEENSSTSIQGWVTNVQKRGKMVFVKVDDGVSPKHVQLVFSKEKDVNVTVGSALKASGSWQKSLGAQQEMDFFVEELDVLSRDSNPRYDTLSADNLRKNVHLRARSQGFAALVKARSRVFSQTHNFFMNRDFVHIDTPMFTRNDCESGGEVFTVADSLLKIQTFRDYLIFGNEKDETLYLTVSSQLHLEAMCSRIPKVYTLSPAFRAEKQQSHAHLCEFRMLEAELAFCDDVETICDLVEQYVKEMISFTVGEAHLQRYISEMTVLRDSHDFSRLEDYLKRPWPRIRYDKAVECLKELGEKLSPNGGINKKNELRLVDHHGSPVFVTHYPANQKPPYMKQNENQETLSFDLLCPVVGELAGGSVRESDVEELRKRGFDIDWYLECRQRGQPVSAGFGIGFERLLQFLFSIRNIKDTIPFPRCLSSLRDMVKVKNRYFLLQLIFNDGVEKDIHPGEIFKEVMKLATDMFGDLGNAALRSSLMVKVADGDVFVLRVESSSEKYVAAALPLVLKISSQPLVVRTLFIGRSMRACEKRLLSFRRNELYDLLRSCDNEAERKVVLNALEKVSGRINIEGFCLRPTKLDYVVARNAFQSPYQFLRFPLLIINCLLTFLPLLTSSQKMSIDEKFEAAVFIVQNLPKEGDVKTSINEKLSFLRVVQTGDEGYKWDAWHKLGDMSSDEAKETYLEKLREKIELTQENFETSSWMGGEVYEKLQPKFAFLEKEARLEPSTNQTEQTAASNSSTPLSDNEYVDAVEDEELSVSRSSSFVEPSRKRHASSLRVSCARVEKELKMIHEQIEKLGKAVEERHNLLVSLFKKCSVYLLVPQKLSWKTVIFFIVWPFFANFLLRYFKRLFA
ncbi:unnamed protein product [Caenorhabditis auriculariae]|uniref:Uncharacterized protein n=1 Tax=Caenorhabditis auriculariae TaxID=2777116 RepID=A0A8S1GZK4_9PELO|nr:unnamed protein product [Caenorhabditis auriculariae]